MNIVFSVLLKDRIWLVLINSLSHVLVEQQRITYNVEKSMGFVYFITE